MTRSNAGNVEELDDWQGALKIAVRAQIATQKIQRTAARQAAAMFAKEKVVLPQKRQAHDDAHSTI